MQRTDTRPNRHPPPLLRFNTIIKYTLFCLSLYHCLPGVPAICMPLSTFIGSLRPLSVFLLHPHHHHSLFILGNVRFRQLNYKRLTVFHLLLSVCVAGLIFSLNASQIAMHYYEDKWGFLSHNRNISMVHATRTRLMVKLRRKGTFSHCEYFCQRMFYTNLL